MEERANEAVMESMTTLREIWANADPELRKRMKTDLGVTHSFSECVIFMVRFTMNGYSWASLLRKSS